jgi:HK97 family phage major capsid protein
MRNGATMYRPANVHGAADAFVPGLGIGFYNALAALEAEHRELVAEEQSLIKAIEKASGKATDEQRERLAQIDQRFGSEDTPGLKAEMEAERRRRERAMAEPSLSASTAVEETEFDRDADKAPTPFRTLGDQLQAVARAALQPHSPVHPGLKAINTWAATGASELVGADGGFLVQQDLQNDLLNAVFTEAVLAPLATTREIGRTSNGIKFNVLDETSRATGSRYGGVRAYWTAEGGQKTASVRRDRRAAPRHHRA